MLFKMERKKKMALAMILAVSAFFVLFHVVFHDELIYSLAIALGIVPLYVFFEKVRKFFWEDAPGNKVGALGVASSIICALITAFCCYGYFSNITMTNAILVGVMFFIFDLYLEFKTA